MKNLVFIIISLVILSLAISENYSYIPSPKTTESYLSSFVDNSNNQNQYGYNEENYSILPCCNNLDPRTNTGPFWSLSCSGQDFTIDSICCVRIWEYYGGQPPSPMPCYVYYERCPIEFD